MAVVTKKSDVITNRDASPRTISNANLSKGSVLEAIGHIALAATDSSASTLNFCTVPSNARISDVIIYNDDSGTLGTLDVGVFLAPDYDTGTYSGGDVIDQDHFASAYALTTASTVGTNIAHESGQFPIEELEQPLWQALGFSEDPNVYFDIVGVLQESPESAADVSLKVRYVI